MATIINGSLARITLRADKYVRIAFVATAATLGVGAVEAVNLAAGAAATNLGATAAQLRSRATHTDDEPAGTRFARQGGNEGGQFSLQGAASGTTLNGDIAFDINGDILRIFETGGSNRGIQINLAELAINVGDVFASRSWVTAAISALVDSSPDLLNTLNELAAAIGDDPNFAATMATALGNRLRVDTASQGLNSTQQANAQTNLGISAFIQTLLDDANAGTARATLGANDASNLNAGTLADARLSSNVPLKDAINTFTTTQYISKSAWPAFVLNRPDSSTGALWITMIGGTTVRWQQGEDASGDWILQRYVTGAFADQPITVSRSDGSITLGVARGVTPGSSDDSTNFATTEWVRDYSAAISAGVVTLNGRSGVVTLELGDVTAVADTHYARLGAANLFAEDVSLANTKGVRHRATGGFTAGSVGAHRFKFSDDNLYDDNYEGDLVFRGASYAEQARLTQAGELRITAGVRFGKCIYLGNNVDLNGNFPAGRYDVENPQNGPWAVPYAYLDVERHSQNASDWQRQTLTSLGSGGSQSTYVVVWQRIKINGTFGPWRPISGFVTPEDLGGKPAGSLAGATTNETAAVARWIDYSLAHPTVPLVLNGFYKITSAIDRSIGSNNGFGIRGMGPAARQGFLMSGTSSRLYFEGADHGNDFAVDQYHFSDFMIGIDSDRSEFALGLKAAPDTGRDEPGLHMNNVHQRRANESLGITGAVFYMLGIRQFDIQNVSAQGKHFAYQGQMFLCGDGPGGAPVEGSFTNVRGAHLADIFRFAGSTGDEANDDWQGMHFDRCTGLAVNKLAHLTTGPETLGFSELVTFSRCHAYYREAFVLLEKVGNVSVDHCYALGHGDLPVIQGVGKTGSSIVNPVAITNSRFKFDASGATRIAINLPSGQTGVCSGNGFQNATVNNFGATQQDTNYVF